jgi:hypothetical protein
MAFSTNKMIFLNPQILWAPSQNVLVLIPVINSDVKPRGVGKEFWIQRYPSRVSLRSLNIKQNRLASKGGVHSLH